MNPQLIEYVRKEVMSGKDIESVITALKKAGHSPKTITAAFQAAMTNSVVDSLPADVSAAKTAKAASGTATHHIDAAQAFVMIGTILILAAIFIVLFIQWDTLTTVTRILFVLFPLIVLFVLSYILSSRPNYHEISDGLLAAGGLIVPLATGTILNQMGILPELNMLMVSVCSFVGVIAFLFFQFGLQKQRFAPLTLLMLYLAVGSIVYHFSKAFDVTLWAIIATAVPTALLGYSMVMGKRTDGDYYFTTGSLVGAICLPIAALSSLNDAMTISYESNMLIIAAFGLFYFFVAWLVGQLVITTGSKSVYQVKRAFEEISPIIFILPFVVVGTRNEAYLLVPLIFSFIMILSSSSVRIKSLLVMGCIGLISAILIAAARYFTDVLGWPVVVMICGFVVLGLALWVRHISALQAKSPQTDLPFGLGLDPRFE
jgi:hypothetical protein